MNLLGRSVLIVMLACVPGVAAAASEDSEFYLGFGGGSSEFTGQAHAHYPYLPGQRPMGRPDTEEIYLGYQHTEQLAFELGRARFDEVHKVYDLIPGIESLFPLIQHEWIDIERMYIGIAISRRLADRLSLIGQIGYSRYDVLETWANDPDPNDSHGLTEYEDLSANGVYYGLGARLHLPGNFAIRWLWTTEDAATFTLRMSRMSLEYRF